MAMSKKDYEMIARTLHGVNNTNRAEGGGLQNEALIRIIVSRFCMDLATDNPRFDPDRFTRACGF